MTVRYALIQQKRELYLRCQEPYIERMAEISNGKHLIINDLPADLDRL
ncbi:hypothetical protein Metfor_1427 [Methanoregula formicica SMSP]|uniref:Uncharacterized protein n=1 Tax=Methanoregula formicica (strain DSM 22288 / NBRC 105244 / SMSP) TaxID=593750 RepID=L0HCJ6_METFS|nr:hypothetical protein Metfor_1427 [Methanoregula formicica SMSP]